MKLKQLFLAVISALTAVRANVADSAMAFPYRMGAGFPGDVNRIHPVSIEPNFTDPDDPPEQYGIPVLVDTVTSGMRQFVAGDTAVTGIYGMTVRPFPIQAQTASNYGAIGFGTGTPPEGQIDIMRTGYIMVNLAAPTGAAKKGTQVFVWCAVDSGDHLQGGIEDVATGGSTAALDATKYMFNGVPDANGNVEIVVNP